jgi:hypothetical protein
VGIWTTKSTKEAYTTEIQRNVPHMSFADQFISENAIDNQCELLKQLKAFRREIVAPATDSNTQLFYQIALTGKSAGRKDDLVMALGIALFYMFRSQNDIPFLDHCQREAIASA